MKITSINAAILAGGLGTRLGGIAKGNLITQKHVKIIVNIINGLEKTGIKNTVISTRPGQNSYDNLGLDIVEDQRVNCGPLGGIEAVLHYFQQKCDAVLFLPCDLPNISNHEINALIQHYLISNNVVVYAKDPHNHHPLCAIVSTSILSDISRALDAGDNKIMNLWRKLNATPIEFTNSKPFVNINNLSDLLQAL